MKNTDYLVYKDQQLYEVYYDKYESQIWRYCVEVEIFWLYESTISVMQELNSSQLQRLDEKGW